MPRWLTWAVVGAVIALRSFGLGSSAARAIGREKYLSWMAML
jgi:hypothetical protein